MGVMKELKKLLDLFQPVFSSLKEEKDINEAVLSKFTKQQGNQDLTTDSEHYAKNASLILDFLVLKAPQTFFTIFADTSNMFKKGRALKNAYSFFNNSIKPAIDYLDSENNVPYITSPILYKKMQLLEWFLVTLSANLKKDKKNDKAIQTIQEKLHIIVERIINYNKQHHLQRALSREMLLLLSQPTNNIHYKSQERPQENEIKKVNTVEEHVSQHEEDPLLSSEENDALIPFFELAFDSDDDKDENSTPCYSLEEVAKAMTAKKVTSLNSLMPKKAISEQVSPTSSVTLDAAPSNSVLPQPSNSKAAALKDRIDNLAVENFKTPVKVRSWSRAFFSPQQNISLHDYLLGMIKLDLAKATAIVEAIEENDSVKIISAFSKHRHRLSSGKTVGMVICHHIKLIENLKRDQAIEDNLIEIRP